MTTHPTVSKQNGAPARAPRQCHVVVFEASATAAVSTAATAPAAATSVTTSAAVPATTATRGALARLVDSERAAAELLSVEISDGAVGVLRRAHLHEAEA